MSEVEKEEMGEAEALFRMGRGGGAGMCSIVAYITANCQGTKYQTAKAGVPVPPAACILGVAGSVASIWCVRKLREMTNERN